MAQVSAEKSDLSTVSFAAEFFTQHQGQEVLRRLVLQPIPPDASSVEKDQSPPKEPLEPVLDGNGDVSSQSQAAPGDPIVNILATITGLEFKLSAGQDRMADWRWTLKVCPTKLTEWQQVRARSAQDLHGAEQTIRCTGSVAETTGIGIHGTSTFSTGSFS